VQIPSLKFTEISALPEPSPDYINERADNIDKSRTAFAIGELGAVGNLYVEDNNTGKVYKINFGADDSRPLDWLQWINKDTFTVAQQGHSASQIVAINVEKQKYEYYGMTSGCPSTPIP
jgi:hypothetical protein